MEICVMIVFGFESPWAIHGSSGKGGQKHVRRYRTAVSLTVFYRSAQQTFVNFWLFWPSRDWGREDEYCGISLAMRILKCVQTRCFVESIALK